MQPISITILFMIANNIPELFIKQVEKRNNNVAFEYRIRRTEPYKAITWHELKELVFDLAYGLIQLGLQKNDNVAIMSETRYEWSVADLAILSSGGVVVPIYPTLSDSGVKYILNDSQSAIVIVEDKGLKKAKEANVAPTRRIGNFLPPAPVFYVYLP